MPEEEIVESTEEVAEPETEQAEEIQAEEPAEETEEVAEETAPPPKKKQTAQERINELTRIRREKEREAEYWRQIALEKSEKKPDPVPEKPATPPRPKLDDFETTTEYEDALFEWRDNVKSAEAEATKRKTEHERLFAEFNERAKAMRAEHEDFDEVIESPVFTPSMQAALLQSENGPQVAYHLGLPENRDLAEKIRSYSPEGQIYEMGKLETQLLIAKKKKTVSSAPAPIKPIGMSGGGGEVDPSKMSINEWMEWDKKRELEKIKQKYSGG